MAGRRKIRQALPRIAPQLLMDHHTVASISIAGSCLDVLGSLYLAYDLLGGPHGPLRLLTRMVTYSVVFGIGFGLGLGWLFGVASGPAVGITVAIELNRATRHEKHFALPWEVTFSAIRACGFCVGVYRLAGLRFAVAFGILNTLGQLVAYLRGIRPGLDYSSLRRPRFTKRHLNGTITRTIGYIVSALLCSVLVQHVDHPWLLATRLGLVTGLVTAAGIVFNPYIEYYADNLPARRLGAFGIGLIFWGFALQSFQYWLVMFDVRVT